MLDVGTDRDELLAYPAYMGARHHRVRGDAYDEFIDRFVRSASSRFPRALLHWEDFGASNARRILNRYREQLCTFNDDMQGTAAVVLGGVTAAVRAAGSALAEQRVVIFGAGTAGIGIADFICSAMVRDGLTPAEAKAGFGASVVMACWSKAWMRECATSSGHTPGLEERYALGIVAMTRSISSRWCKRHIRLC